MSFNKIGTGIFALVGLILVNVFSDRVNDILDKYFLSSDNSDIKQTAKIKYLNNKIIDQIKLQLQAFEENKKIDNLDMPYCDEATTLDVKTRCYGILENDTFLYVGEIINNSMDGQGRYFDKEFKSLEYGQFRNGATNGYAIKEDSYGNLIYDGNWKDGLYHGYGEWFLDDQSYKGSYVEGLKEGKGRYDFGDRIYEGEWKKDFEHGYGKTIYQNGDIAEGQYVYGLKDGKTRITYNNGSIFEGHFKAGKRHGVGTSSIHLGKDLFDIFEGNYYRGKRHGKGRYTYANGDQETGTYRFDQLHGESIVTFKDGGSEYGQYQRDQKHGMHEIIYPGGYQEIANYKNGNLHGVRKIKYKNGDSEESVYKDGLREGKNAYIYKFTTGQILVCDYEDGMRHGQCIDTYPSGEKLLCVWKKGEPGECTGVTD